MKHYKWVKDVINKLITANMIQGSWPTWSAPIIMVPKGRWRKISSHGLLCTQQDHTKFYLAYVKSRIKDNSSLPKTAFTSPFEKYEYIKVPFGLAQAPAYFQELMAGVLKDFPFCYCLPGWYNRLQQDGRGTPRPTPGRLLKHYGMLIYHWSSANANFCQRDPVPWTHPQHHRHQTTTIKNMHPPKTAK